LSAPRALLLDAGGVLYHHTSDYPRVVFERAASHLRTLGASATPESVSRVLDNWRLDPHVQQDIFYAASLILSRHGLIPTPARAEALAETMADAVVSSMILAPGAGELLHWAKRVGLLVAVVSNNWCRVCLLRALTRDNIVHLVDALVSSDSVGFAKPHPAIYNAALGLLGVEPQYALFIDDYGPNVEAAKSLGIKAILHDGRPLYEYIPVVSRLLLEVDEPG